MRDRSRLTLSQRSSLNTADKYVKPEPGNVHRAGHPWEEIEPDVCLLHTS